VAQVSQALACALQAYYETWMWNALLMPWGFAHLALIRMARAGTCVAARAQCGARIGRMLTDNPRDSPISGPGAAPMRFGDAAAVDSAAVHGRCRIKTNQTVYLLHKGGLPLALWVSKFFWIKHRLAEGAR